MMWYWIALVIVLLLVLIWWESMTWNTPIYENYIAGMYRAEDDDFCNSADIDSMSICIGDKIDGVRQAHIVIMPNLSHQGFVITAPTGYAGATINTYVIKAKVEFDEEQIWSEYVTMSFDMSKGMLKITDSDNVVLALLYKDNEMTELHRDVEII